MILVDTSVLIDYLQGIDNEKSRLLDAVVEGNVPFGISAYTYQEVLQGARDEAEYATLDANLSTQKIYFLPSEAEAFAQAARLYFDLRRKGKTVRSSIDLLIAQTAIHYKLALLHNDRDFDVIASVAKALKIFKVP
jgi:predicted nucleic acid-binding protein